MTGIGLRTKIAVGMAERAVESLVFDDLFNER